MTDLATPPFQVIDPQNNDLSNERLTERWRREDLNDPSSDPTRPSLAASVEAGHAFSVPWAGDARKILTGFTSSTMIDAKGPWLPSCAIDTGSVHMTTVLSDLQGGIASFRDGYSTHSGSSQEHLSAGLGVSVGYPFLKASVSGKYDRSVLENENGVQASRNATCRVGRILLDSMPPLSHEAVLLLCSEDGPARFQAVYGDYFVCGYELGGDAGACLSASSKSSSKETTLELKLTVKVLFVKKSVSTIKRDVESSSSSTFTFNGYTTFGSKSASVSATNLSAEDQGRVQRAAAEYLTMVADLPNEIRKQVRKLHLIDGRAVPLSFCSGICESGLVVQLLLAPFARLNEFTQLLSHPPASKDLEALRKSSMAFPARHNKN